MAVGTYLAVYPGKYLSEQDFAVLTDALSFNKSGVLKGCTVTTSGSTIRVASGWCLVRGRVVRVEGGTLAASLPSSGTKTQYVLLKVSVYSGGAGVTDVFLSDSISGDASDFNGNGGNAYLNIATLVLSSSGATVSNQTNAMSVRFKSNKQENVTIQPYNFVNLTVPIPSDVDGWKVMSAVPYCDGSPLCIATSCYIDNARQNVILNVTNFGSTASTVTCGARLYYIG